MARFAVRQPHLEKDVPLTRAAANAGVSLRTAQRWLTRYRRHGLAGLARPVRCDAGGHRAPADLVRLIEGMGLKKPRSSAAAIHRRVGDVATAPGWRPPSYGTVRAILSRLDPAMVALALDGPAAYRDRYELIHRHRAPAPNALWQADPTSLDLLVLDEDGKPVRPWLTTVVDDHSRAVAGYMVFLGAPCVLNTCLALRHAQQPCWPWWWRPGRGQGASWGYSRRGRFQTRTWRSGSPSVRNRAAVIGAAKLGSSSVTLKYGVPSAVSRLHAAPSSALPA
jgi:putative transposase